MTLSQIYEEIVNGKLAFVLRHAASKLRDNGDGTTTYFPRGKPAPGARTQLKLDLRVPVWGDLVGENHGMAGGPRNVAIDCVSFALDGTTQPVRYPQMKHGAVEINRTDEWLGIRFWEQLELDLGLPIRRVAAVAREHVVITGGLVGNVNRGDAVITGRANFATAVGSIVEAGDSQQPVRWSP